MSPGRTLCKHDTRAEHVYYLNTDELFVRRGQFDALSRTSGWASVRLSGIEKSCFINPQSQPNKNRR